MNRYDFDFRRIEDVLNDTLGIVDVEDIISLKMQIRESLDALSESIDRKKDTLGNVPEDKVATQKNALYRELEEIADETDLEKVLRKCIIIRRTSLLSLDEKVRPEDSFQEQSDKRTKRNEIFAIYDLMKAVDSIIDLMNSRRKVLKRIDSKNRKIRFDTTPTLRPEKLEETEKPETADDSQTLENSEEIEKNEYPEMMLDIQFKAKPGGLPEEYKKCLEDAGIYAYDFGDAICSDMPDESGKYTREVMRKKMVGIIKRDEFGELKKYPVLVNDEFEDVPPEFYRDIVFSDMLLRNAKNNLNVLGVPKPNPADQEYGYKITFDEPGLSEYMRAIYFENNPQVVKIDTNFHRVRGIADACVLMQEKMQQAVNELLENEKKDSEKTLGDD